MAALFFLIGLAPLLLANIASGGATFREVFGTANSPSVQFSPPLPTWPSGHRAGALSADRRDAAGGTAACDGN